MSIVYLPGETEPWLDTSVKLRSSVSKSFVEQEVLSPLPVVNAILKLLELLKALNTLWKCSIIVSLLSNNIPCNIANTNCKLESPPSGLISSWMFWIFLTEGEIELSYFFRQWCLFYNYKGAWCLTVMKAVASLVWAAKTIWVMLLSIIWKGYPSLSSPT